MELNTKYINNGTIIFIVPFFNFYKMIGKPKYKLEDEVSFKLSDNKQLTGNIIIIDKYGTFEQNENVSYDILVNACDEYPDGCLFKHIPEHLIIN